MSKHEDKNVWDNAYAKALAVALPIGVALAITLDNWAFLAIGLALAPAFAAAMGTKDHEDDEGGAAAAPEDGPADPRP